MNTIIGAHVHIFFFQDGNVLHLEAKQCGLGLGF